MQCIETVLQTLRGLLLGCISDKQLRINGLLVGG
jgi:hypothetical protein